jgi:glucosamine--fructose-6-phosphate aminotransferase (isomerizing)
MCGIIGYIGKKQAQPVLLNGLKRLEYRGYDSAGICVFSERKNALSLRKLPGKVKGLEALLKKKPLSGSLGVGHCLAPDTLILLADGRYVPISRLEDGQEVFAFNLKNKKLEAARARVMSHRSPRYLYNLRTPFTSLQCTAQHRMFILSDNGIIEKKAGDIQKGDALIMPIDINIQAKKIRFKPIFVKRYFRASQEANRLIKSRLEGLQLTTTSCASSAGISRAYMDHILKNDRNFREDQLQKLLSIIPVEFNHNHFIPQNTIHGKFIRLPGTSSPGLMQIIGYLLGDGTVREKTLRFKDLDKELLLVYRDLIERSFNVQGRVIPQAGTRAWLLEVNSFYLCQWLKENIISRQEEFLSALGQLPKDEIAAFLRGIFDAEGCVHLKSGQLSLRLTNRRLVKVAQFLLLRCGIISSFYRENKNVKNWNDSYGVFLSNLYSFDKFNSAIGLSSTIKSERLQALLARRRQGKTSTKYKKIYYDNIVPQPILDIRKIQQKHSLLFDLEIEHPDSNFIANGLLSHNSRWATHGKPNQANAHPHLDCAGEIAVVHNGIIENYAELKQGLSRQGHKFKSQTDTEVIPHLIERFYKNLPLEQAVGRAASQLSGSFAIAVMSRREPDKLIGVRCGSPLIVGLGESESFLASDIPAVLDYTKEVLFLEEKEIAVLSRDSLRICDFAGRQIQRQPVAIDWDAKQAQKGGFAHFMLKEINEQPDILENILKYRIQESQIQFEELKISQEELAGISSIVIIACGTAYHAGLVGKYILEELVRVPVSVDVSSEFRYRQVLLDKQTLVIAISQSGETADTLAALRLARERGARVLGICNVVGSSLTRECDGIIYTHAGPEISVASTKAYTAQLAALYLFAIYLAGARLKIPPKFKQGYLAELKQISRLQRRVLAGYKSIKRLAQRHSHLGSFLFLGRNINYPSALEGALKLKEISYIPAEGYAAGEMKHGPIALIDEYRAVVCICAQSRIYEKMLSNVQEIRARRGKIIILATEGDDKIGQLSPEVLYIPKIDEFFSPLLVALPLQLLAYFIAVKRGCDVDQPRNLAKSVTVE